MQMKKRSVFIMVFLGLLICVLFAGHFLFTGKMSDSDFVSLCMHGSLQQVNAAIRNGANVNARDITGISTPILSAAGFNPNPEVISALINAGADVNSENILRRTPLMTAANLNPNPEIISALINAGADVNARDNNGDTPLIWATMLRGNPNPEVITILANAGADVNAENNLGRTPLMVAASLNPNPEVITILIKAGADVNPNIASGNTPLMMAAKGNPNPEIISTLINAGADVNAENHLGGTPLMVAADLNPNPEVITILVKAGAEVNPKSTNGFTPLIRAATNNPNPEVITALANAGADVNDRDMLGNTVFKSAIIMGSNPEALTALIEAGADVNARDRFLGATPLMIAVLSFFNPEEMITTLLELGADPRLRNNFGMTALDLANMDESLRNTDAFRILQEATLQDGDAAQRSGTWAGFDFSGFDFSGFDFSGFENFVIDVELLDAIYEIVDNPDLEELNLDRFEPLPDFDEEAFWERIKNMTQEEVETDIMSRLKKLVSQIREFRDSVDSFYAEWEQKALESGVTFAVGDTGDFDESQVVADGFTALPVSDGSSIYIKMTVESFIMLDFKRNRSQIIRFDPIP